ncbi:class I SAM-dependent methyltransferase [Pseudonocardia alni]|uniref:class I SAM-dependent methyltransferase n=1 Tax=Pseudonocardia alni TaxID=33907 RepID=UPI002799546C|nr:class I SAM-dependent methyltransferase [Pseudonocardia alni]
MSTAAASPLFDRVLAGAGPGSRLLDVGCGAGRLLADAAAAGLAVTGVDTEPRALAAAERAAPGADLRVADAHELPFADDAFDLVTLVQVLEHLPNPVLALRGAGRVCAPSGAVRATVWGTPTSATPPSSARRSPRSPGPRPRLRRTTPGPTAAASVRPR